MKLGLNGVWSVLNSVSITTFSSSCLKLVCCRNPSPSTIPVAAVSEEKLCASSSLSNANGVDGNGVLAAAVVEDAPLRLWSAVLCLWGNRVHERLRALKNQVVT